MEANNIVIVNRRVLDHVDISLIYSIWLFISVSVSINKISYIYILGVSVDGPFFDRSNVIFIPACGHSGEEKGAFLIPVPLKKMEPKDRDRFFVMLCLHVFFV